MKNVKKCCRKSFDVLFSYYKDVYLPKESLIEKTIIRSFFPRSVGIDACRASTEALAQKTEAIVVSVGFRQAPEFKFPTTHDDSYAAYGWVLENAGTFKGQVR